MAAEVAQALTVVVRRVVKPGHEAVFEATMREFIADAMTFPGSCEFHVVRPSAPAAREYTVFHRFVDAQARRAFVASPAYGDWMARLRSLTESEPRIEEFGGLAGWFTLPGRRPAGPPPRYKMAMVTFFGVYPLTALLPGLFGGLLPGWHPLVTNVVTTGTIVALLTWLVMPGLTRVFAAWLFPCPDEPLEDSA